MTSITNGLYDITSALSDNLYIGRPSPEDASLLPKSIVGLRAAFQRSGAGVIEMEDVSEPRVRTRLGTKSVVAVVAACPVNVRSACELPWSCRWKGIVSESAKICTSGMKSCKQRVLSKSYDTRRI